MPIVKGSIEIIDRDGKLREVGVQTLATGLDAASIICHGAAAKSGWWTAAGTNRDVREMPEEYMKLWVGTKLALVHSEVSEGLEGHRKDLMDDKLPHRKMLEVELADALIRILDLAEGLGYDIAGAAAEKILFNATREDHKPENRAGENGKSY